MAPKKPSKRSRAKQGYHVDGGISWPIYQLRSLFLKCVADVCPEAIVAYQALAPVYATAEAVFRDHEGADAHLRWSDLEHIGVDHRDGTDYYFPTESAAPLLELREALLEWAERYFLSASWVLDGAVFGLGLSVRYSSTATLRPGVTVYRPPASTPPLTFEAPGYSGDDSRVEYRKATLELLERHLDEHIDGVVDRLEGDPHVVAVPRFDKRTAARVLHAAQWQTLGQHIADDGRGVREILRRIGLTPRPGLTASGKTQPL